MKKLLLTTVACVLLVTQAQADKIDDSFAEVNGLWCYSSRTEHLDPAPKGWETTIYTRLNEGTNKRCTRATGDWLFVDDNTGLNGSEYSCVTVEGGDNGWQSVKIDNGKRVRRMVFSFRQRCNAEGFKWNRDVRIMLGEKDELFVGVKSVGKKK
jgi:hypothetical protein